MPTSHACLFVPSLLPFYAAVAALACIFSASNIHASSNITLGSKLFPGNTTGWVSSPNQSFHLAFYSPANSNSFSIGILYNLPGINGTVVWTAGGNIQVSSSGSFELSTDGFLLLKNDSVTTVWNNSIAKAAGASMGDDGNFIVFNSSGTTIWQSFDSPTDTLVLNQRFPLNESLTAGNYSATMQPTGNLSLTYIANGGYTYWSSDTAGVNSSASYAILDSSGRLSVNSEDGQSLASWYSNDYTSTSSPAPVRRVTLDTDGNLRIHTWSAGSSTSGWTVGWQALEDLCEIYAYCGPNGLCGYNQTGIICSCATQAGFAFNDEKDPRSGCKAIAGKGGQNCTGAMMVELNNTLLFVSGTQNTNFRFGGGDCSKNCLQNPVCTAATALSDGSGTCQEVYGSASTFFSGYQELSTATNSYFKYCGSNVPPASSNGVVLGPAPSPVEKKSAATVPVVVSVLATLAIIASVQGGIWWVCCRQNPRWGGYSAQYALMEYASGAPVQFTYKELRRATGNFKEKLGEGGFGAVYKGELPTTSEGGAGLMDVAVKRLEGLADQGEKQFRMEVAVIGSTHHMNLVRLCGFCAEGEQRLLVYEYMRHGSLDRYLFAGEEAAATVGDSAVGRDSVEDDDAVAGATAGGQRRRDMDWETRFSVLLGTARGITYLHQECRDCIIHSDIKPENILLDDTFTAKVSDFGLAKLTRGRHQGASRHVTTLVRGTRGYLAPEWRSNLPITVKSDVFSFGMVVLETISGRKSFDRADTSSTSTRHASFPEWAYRQFFHHKQVEGVIDERIRGNVDMEQLEHAMKVAFWCLQVQPSVRPSMSKVIQMLDGSMQDVQIPPMPKSFGDHVINVANEEEDSMYILRAFEQESFAPTSGTSYANTFSSSPISHTPNYSFSQSVISHQSPHPPPRDNVPYSF
eukprot:c25248_g3_i1 orf=242-2989(+)